MCSFIRKIVVFGAVAVAVCPSAFAQTQERMPPAGVSVPVFRASPVSYVPVKSGVPVPVAVTLMNPSSSFSGSLSAWVGSSDSSEHCWRQSLSVGRGKFLFHLYPQVGLQSVANSMTVELLDSRNRVIGSEEIHLRPDGAKWVVWAVVGSNRKFTADEVEMPFLSVTMLRKTEFLPDAWFGYKAADVMVWDVSVVETLTAAQKQALEEWLCTGGRLVLVAKYGDTSLQCPLPSLLPKMTVTGREGTVTSVAELPVSRARRYAEKSVGLGCLVWCPVDYSMIARTMTADERNQLMGVPSRFTVSSESGQTGTEIGSYVVRDRRALSGLAQSRDDAEESLRIFGEGGKVEEEYYHGQHGSAVRMVQSVVGKIVEARPIAFWPVLVTMIGYLLCISVIDYVVLKRIRRLPWTWFTFPVIIAVFAVISFHAFYRGRLGSLSRYEVVCSDIAADGRGETWTMACVVNNANRPVRLNLDPGLYFKHFGRSELYGVWYGYGRDKEARRLVVEISGSGRVADVPAHVGQHVFVKEDSPVLGGKTAVGADLSRDPSNGRLKGEFTFTDGHLPEKCFVYDRRSWFAVELSADGKTGVLKASTPAADAVHNPELLDQMYRYNSGPDEPLAAFVALVTGEPSWSRKKERRSVLDALGNGMPVVVAFYRESDRSGTAMKTKRIRCLRQVLSVLTENAK